MVLLEPKGYQPVSGAPVIFLAGPIHGAPRWKATATLGQFHRQRAWERHYMDLAALLPQPRARARRRDRRQPRRPARVGAAVMTHVELRTPVYQSDYMEWLKPLHPEESLAFYLRTAERIDVNLGGVSPSDLREATIGIGRRVDERFELPRPFMTSWATLGARVPKERIIED